LSFESDTRSKASYEALASSLLIILDCKISACKWQSRRTFMRKHKGESKVV